jgi:hypothetical protein
MWDIVWRLAPHGEIHRDFGPAIITRNGTQAWYFRGYHITKYLRCVFLLKTWMSNVKKNT